MSGLQSQPYQNFSTQSPSVQPTPYQHNIRHCHVRLDQRVINTSYRLLYFTFSLVSLVSTLSTLVDRNKVVFF